MSVTTVTLVFAEVYGTEGYTFEPCRVYLIPSQFAATAYARVITTGCGCTTVGGPSKRFLARESGLRPVLILVTPRADTTNPSAARVSKIFDGPPSAVIPNISFRSEGDRRRDYLRVSRGCAPNI